jgi:integrase
VRVRLTVEHLTNYQNARLGQVFPWHGRQQKIDPTRPMTLWRSAWRSIRCKAARDDAGETLYPALQDVRFHDLRHTAVTTMAEKGLPEQTIMAQVGHISPQMMKTYSHVRRLALNAAAAARGLAYFKRL